jgi:hypothetical protein
MEINYIICPDRTQEKIISRHRVTLEEARQVMLRRLRIRFPEKGYVEDNDVYVAFG